MGPGIDVPGNARASAICRHVSPLQWGPGLMSRETHQVDRVLPHFAVASMGPGIDVPGNDCSEFVNWLYAHLQCGPGLMSRETFPRWAVWRLTGELQWGPGLMSRETSRSPRASCTGSSSFNGARD